jgi:hypothetical protein
MPQPPDQSARQIVVAGAIAVLVIVIFASARLGAVVLATPLQQWADENPPLFDPAVKVASGTAQFARRLSQEISDAGVFRGLQSVCFPEEPAKESDYASCLEQVDAALAAAPSSGELWYLKASVLALDGQFGAPLVDALRNSYVTARAEGAVAAQRVILGLRLFEILPDDLRAAATADLQIISAVQNLLRPFAEAYVADDMLRTSATAAIRTLGPDKLWNLFAAVRQATDKQLYGVNAS